MYKPNDDINEVTNFFYTKIAQRISNRINASNLTHEQIYPPDHKIISRIVNNIRTKKNPYLIYDGVIDSNYLGESGEYEVCGLLNKLNFNSRQEIFFGTSDEIEQYLQELFICIWFYIVGNKCDYKMEPDDYLIDYAPYSLDISLLKNRINYGFSSSLFGYDDNTVDKTIQINRTRAIMKLYEPLEVDFKNSFNAFIKNIDSLKKFDKKLKESFIDKFVSEILLKYEPCIHSRGKRVYDIIETDLYPLAYLKSIGQFTPIHESGINFLKLAQLSKRYIDELVKLEEEPWY